MDLAAKEVFEELSSHLQFPQINSTHEVCEGAKPSVGEQSNILENNIKTCELIFPDYGDETNEKADNCISQFNEFNAEIFTIHVQDTQDEVGKPKVSYIIQKSSHSAITGDESLKMQEPKPLILSQEEEDKTYDLEGNEGANSVKKSVSCYVGEDCNTAGPGNYENITGVQKSEGRKVQIELNENTLLLLHGIDPSLPVTCDICEINFGSMSDFDEHMKKHIETRVFMCQICPKTFMSWQNLVAHRNVCHNDKFIACKDCAPRKQHFNLGPVSFPIGDFPVGCEECHKGFKSAQELYHHYRICALDKHGNADVEKTSKGMYLRHSKIRKLLNSEDGVTFSFPLHGKGKQEDVCETTNTTNAYKCKMHEGKLFPFDEFHSHSQNHVIAVYRCSFCERTFKDKVEYRKHRLSHVQRKKYKCGKCFKIFYSMSALYAHKYVHPTVNKYRCFNCQMEYNTSEEMMCHIKRVHYQNPAKKLICDICTTSHSICKFMEHYMICHKREKQQKLSTQRRYLSCAVCGMFLPNPRALRHHVKLHESTNLSYLCEICGVIIQQAISFTAHIKSHEMERSTNLTEVNTTMKEIKEVPQESINKAKSFICEYCNKKFQSRKDLLLHIQRHIGKKPYVCKWCPKSFYTKTQLAEHQNQHLKRPPVTCSVCNKSFTHSSVLCRHLRHRSSATQYTCPVCEKTFLLRSTYHSHVRNHSEIRLYKCDDCSETFMLKDKLTLHKKIHKEMCEKNKLEQISYECYDCGQTFTSSKELENHHEEKCYLTMITFLSANSDENRQSSPLIFVNDDDNKISSLVPEQKEVF